MKELDGKRKGEKDEQEEVYPGADISMLREAEVDVSTGQSVELVCRKLGITVQTYSRWRKEYGGMRVD